jgi:hypothetical protein
VSGVVLDTGALIALERNDGMLWAVLKLAALRTRDVLVPSTALARAWRGRVLQARLFAALRHCVIASFDPVARDVGELCGRARTNDICDAHVALVAATQGDILYTSDPADMRRLITTIGRKRLPIVPC